MSTPRPSPDAADVCAELREAAAQVDADLAHFGKVHIQTGVLCEAACLKAAAEIARLRALVAGGEWVRCSERLPERGVKVLAWSGWVGVARLESSAAFGLWWIESDGAPYARNGPEPTHWRPLPPPPSEGGE